MNKIKQILIGAAALAVSANASAIIINDDGSETMEYSDYAGLIQDVIDGKYSDTARNERLAGKVAKKQNKINRKIAKLESGDLSNKRERKITRHVSRLESKIARIMTRMDLTGQLPDAVALAINGDGGNESVPEPSTIALLGLGLVGIGVARRMRKKT